MAKRIYVIAPNFREAEYWARHFSDPPLKPSEWQYVSDIHVLRGTRDITIVVYDRNGIHGRPLEALVEIGQYVRDGVYGWVLREARNNG